MLKQGDTFLISSPRNEVEHLWIVLTEPDEENQSLCVNITTAQDGSDLTVELNKGDHPFIKHPSVVNYFDARLMVLQDVETMIAMPHKTRVCAKDHPCEKELLAKISKGLLASKFTPRKAREYLRGL
jgi:hypothetical protein